MELPRKANKNTMLWFFNLFCNYIVCIIRKYLKYDLVFLVYQVLWKKMLKSLNKCFYWIWYFSFHHILHTICKNAFFNPLFSALVYFVQRILFLKIVNALDMEFVPFFFDWIWLYVFCVWAILPQIWVVGFFTLTLSILW